MNPIESIKGYFASRKLKTQVSLNPIDTQDVSSLKPVLTSTTGEIDMQLAQIAQAKAAIAVNQRKVDEVVAEAQKRLQAEENIKKAQEFYNKPFEDALSHKSAGESAAVFEEAGLLDKIDETAKKESASFLQKAKSKASDFIQAIKKHKIIASLTALTVLAFGGFKFYKKQKSKVAGFSEKA